MRRGPPFFHRACGARGFSLVELMVSMVIGMVVVGALLAAWLAVSQSRSNIDAATQMSDDAGTALQVLRQHVGMAGYRAPTTVAAGLAPLAPPLFGCDGGRGWLGGTQAAIGALGACDGRGAGPDWLAISYQVDVDASGPRPAGNAVLSGDRSPYDCAGNRVAATGGAWLVDSHFYVAVPGTSSRPALFCRQGGTASSVPGQVIAENVVDFQVQYLLSAGPPPPPGASAPGAWYSDAPDTQPGPGSRFDQVVAVRLCIEVTSATPVADRRQPQSYLDCANVLRQPTDGYLHRAFATSVTLQNRT